MTALELLAPAVGSGRARAARALAQRALDEGLAPGEILDRAFGPAAR